MAKPTKLLKQKGKIGRQKQEEPVTMWVKTRIKNNKKLVN